jgi:opacity protein-like surface antigen
MKKIVAIAASALVFAAPAMAQEGPSEGDVAAYYAINFSTVGALPPLATATLSNAGGASWHLQYGRLSLGDDANTNAFGGGVEIGLGAGRLGLTAGYMTFSCPTGLECDGHLMVGTRYSHQLTSSPIGKNGDRWQMGLEADIGLGLPEDSRALAISAGIPVKLTFGKNIKVSPFVTPAFAHGSYKVDDVSESAMKFMVGAGVGVGLRSGIGVNLGMRKVFVDEGETQYGLGFTIRPGK